MNVNDDSSSSILSLRTVRCIYFLVEESVLLLRSFVSDQQSISLQLLLHDRHSHLSRHLLFHCHVRHCLVSLELHSTLTSLAEITLHSVASPYSFKNFKNLKHLILRLIRFSKIISLVLINLF